MPPARAPERDANPRRSSSLSRRRTPRRSARSPTNRCPLAPSTAASDAAATPPPQAAPARAGPGPPNEPPHDCAWPATGSGERTGQTRVRARAGPPRLRSLPRSRQPVPALRCQRSPSPSQRLATAGGTAGGAGSSRCDLPDGRASGHQRSPLGADAAHVPDGFTSRRRLGPSLVPGDHSASATVFAGFRAICRCERRQKASNRRLL